MNRWELLPAFSTITNGEDVCEEEENPGSYQVYPI